MSVILGECMEHGASNAPKIVLFEYCMQMLSKVEVWAVARFCNNSMPMEGGEIIFYIYLNVLI